MSVLNKRLLRSIKKNKVQFFAMVLIVWVGICMYVGLTGTYASLSQSQFSFYAQNHFSGHMFIVAGAPDQIVRRIEDIEHIETVEGRNQEDVKLVSDTGSRAQVRLTGYNTDPEKALHYPFVTEGKYPDAVIRSVSLETLADAAFFAANEIKEGDEVYIIVSGKQVKLNIIGAAVSPEYIYIVKDASSLFPDPSSFGIIFLPEEQLEAILGRSGQINQILITWQDGESSDHLESIEQIKDMLKPYGLIADIPQKDYPSHNLLKMEVDNLKVMATALPFLFLSVAAMVEIIILRRSVSSQRLNIGIMKAQGFSNHVIMMSFATYSLLVTVLGTILGILSGYLLANWLTVFYGSYFHLPYTMKTVDYSSVVMSLIIGPLIGIGSGFAASRKVTRIQAAEAMRAEPPKAGKTVAIEEITWIWRALSSQWRMAVRSAGRNMGRFFVVTLGMISTTALLLLSFYMNDAVDFMLTSYFEEDIKYDYVARFDQPVHKREIPYFENIPGLTDMEPFVEISAKVEKSGKSEDDSFRGIVAGSIFKEIRDQHQNILPLPERGILISNVTARKIGASTGDEILVKTEPRPGVEKYVTLTVMGVNEQMMGAKTLCSLEQAGFLMDDPGMVSGIMMNVRDGYEEALEGVLNDTPGIASWSSKADEQEAIMEMMGIMPSMIAIMVSLSLILGFAVLYNTGVINLAERKNEIATLRTIGFTVGEVRGILFKETLIQSIVGYAAGLPLGYLMISHYMGSLSSDMYTFPVIIHWQSYVYAAVPAFLLIFFVSRLTTRDIAKMDLVEVTRIRE